MLEASDVFDEDLVRGIDSEFFVRVCQGGDRLVLAPRTWTFHPAPATLGRLVHKHFFYGIGYAQEVQRHPERAAGRSLTTPAHAAVYVAVRTAMLPVHAMSPTPTPRARCVPASSPSGPWPATRRRWATSTAGTPMVGARGDEQALPFGARRSYGGVGPRDMSDRRAGA